MKTILVTGSSGLIGSEVCVFFSQQGFAVHGVDNNQREAFFGPQGNTRWNLEISASVFLHRYRSQNPPGQRLVSENETLQSIDDFGQKPFQNDQAVDSQHL